MRRDNIKQSVLRAAKVMAEHEVWQSRAMKLRKCNSELKSEIEIQKQQTLDLSNEIQVWKKRAMNARKGIQDKNEIHKSEMDKLKREYEVQMERLQLDVHRTNADISSSDEKSVQALETVKLQETLLEFKQYKLENEQYKLENEQLKLDNEQLKLDNEQLQVENEELKSASEQLQVENEELKLASEQFKLENNKAQLKCEQLLGENEQLQVKNEQLKSTSEKLKLEEENKKEMDMGEIRKVEMECDGLKKQLAMQKKRSEKAMKSIENRAKQVGPLSIQVNELKQKLLELQSRCKMVEGELKTARGMATAQDVVIRETRFMHKEDCMHEADRQYQRNRRNAVLRCVQSKERRERLFGMRKVFRQFYRWRMSAMPEQEKLNVKEFSEFANLRLEKQIMEFKCKTLDPLIEKLLDKENSLKRTCMHTEAIQQAVSTMTYSLISTQKENEESKCTLQGKVREIEILTERQIELQDRIENLQYTIAVQKVMVREATLENEAELHKEGTAPEVGMDHLNTAYELERAKEVERHHEMAMERLNTECQKKENTIRSFELELASKQDNASKVIVLQEKIQELTKNDTSSSINLDEMDLKTQQVQRSNSEKVSMLQKSVLAHRKEFEPVISQAKQMVSDIRDAFCKQDSLVTRLEELDVEFNKPDDISSPIGQESKITLEESLCAKSQTIVVKAGATFQVPIPAMMVDGCIEYSFSVEEEDSDIDFELQFINSDGIATIIDKKHRVQSEDGQQESRIAIKEIGRFLLIWDNSHSWFNEKTICYSVTTLEPCTHEHRVAKRNAEKQHRQLSQINAKLSTIEQLCLIDEKLVHTQAQLETMVEQLQSLESILVSDKQNLEILFEYFHTEKGDATQHEKQLCKSNEQIDQDLCSLESIRQEISSEENELQVNRQLCPISTYKAESIKLQQAQQQLRGA